MDIVFWTDLYYEPGPGDFLYKHNGAPAPFIYWAQKEPTRLMIERCVLSKNLLFYNFPCSAGGRHILCEYNE